MKPNYIVNVRPTFFQIACLSGTSPIDTQDSGYMFNVFGISVEEFINTLKEINDWSEKGMKNYLSNKTWEIRAGTFSDNLTITHHAGSILSIVRGQIKVLFHGHSSLIYGAVPDLILESKRTIEQDFEREDL